MPPQLIMVDEWKVHLHQAKLSILGYVPSIGAVYVHELLEHGLAEVTKGVRAWRNSPGSYSWRKMLNLGSHSTRENRRLKKEIKQQDR